MPIPLMLLPLAAQAVTVEPGTAAATADRFAKCLEQARIDPTGALVTATTWVGEATGTDRAYAQECVGMANTALQSWADAHAAFLTARGAASPDNYQLRYKLAAMAGNAALAQQQYDEALADFSLALSDAGSAGETIAQGEIEIDRARALVGAGKMTEAGLALAQARSAAPNNAEAWLLSATLARRTKDYTTASTLIATARQLDPGNPAIGLEAGVIAVLQGDPAAARSAWQGVVAEAGSSAEGQAAQRYLAQLDEIGATEGGTAKP